MRRDTSKETEETKNGRIIVKNRRLEIVPDEAHVVRLMFELYAYKNYSYNGITTYLNDQGFLYRNSKKWSTNRVHHILNQTVHMGELNYAGIITEIEPIISKELWEAVEEKRKHNAQHRRHSINPNYNLARRVTCFHCGYHMVVTQTGTTFRYRCRCAYNYGVDYFAREGKTCDNRKIYNGKLVDDRVLGYQDYLELQTKRYQPLLDDLARVERLISKKKAKLERLLDAYLDEVIAKDILQEKRHDLERELKTAKITKADLERELNEFLNLPNKIQAVNDLREITHKAFKNGIPHEKFRELIEALDVKIQLEKATDGIYVHITSIAGKYVVDDLQNCWRLKSNGKSTRCNCRR